MKRKVIYGVLLVIFILLLVFLFQFLNIIDRIKLNKIGYSIKEQNVILSKLDDLDIVYENDYIKELIDILNCDNYNENNLKLYLDYINTYVKDRKSICTSVIKSAENNIELEYNEDLENLINEKYFIKENLDRYLDYKKNNKNLSYNQIVSNVNANIDYEFYTNIQESDISKNELIIVNKYYKLSPTFKNGLVELGSYSVDGYYKMERVAFEAYKELYNDALNDGIKLKIRSAYRSYYDQQYIYDNYVLSDGINEADRYSARPGHSEHQTGLAIDVSAESDLWGDFSNTKEFTWMKENSYKYGFILRYPLDKEYITGYMYEPWHYRYVGKDVAKYIYENDITYDEYYAYFIQGKGE